MALEKPPLPTAEPGRPITAQGWNAIVDALGDLYDAVAAIGSGVLAVDVTSGGSPVLGATVQAVLATGGNPVVAAPPIGTRTSYVLAGVSDGSWTVTAAAAGFTPASVTTAVPAPGPVVLELTPVGPPVPDLFAQPLQTAFSTLAAASIGVGTMLDTLGKEVPRTPIPAEYQNTPVLAQLPPAGTRIAPADRVHLVVAATAAQAPIVTMPNLAGLTQDEAARVLEQLGLRLGRVQIIPTPS